MKISSLLVGALLGGITSLPLMGLMFLGAQVAPLPFVPFDLFEWITRQAMPGPLVAMLIDMMVRFILLSHLGEISSAAKLLEQLIAIGTMIIVSILFGAAIAYSLMRSTWSAGRIGFAGGSLLLVVVLAVEVVRGFPGNPVLGVPWLALLFIGWGMLLARWTEIEIGRERGARAAESYQPGRRALLLKIAGGSVAVALAAWGLGSLSQQQRVESGADQPLPGSILGPPRNPAGPSAQQTAEAGVQRIEPVPGARPEATPNETFYRIDIDLLPPSISQALWKLDVKGLFDRPRSLSLSNLMAYPPVTQPVTLSCISNPIGGGLIGNAYWTGLRLADLLKHLGIRPEARQLFIEAADGFYETVETADLMDPRTLLVYGMDGTTLPMEHGFPLRILIPNRYGMKQPKWITSIEAINGSGSGYWVDREWSKEARPQIVSVIDAVAKDNVVNGRVPIGGIAWAGDRGIQKVEVQVDGGAWEAATLRVPPLGPLTWVQWRYDWPRIAGSHTFRVRATDGTGALQIEQPTDTFPNGATGYDSVTETI
ncbi:MAG: molybdopterin-dependent oxidoreductase [Bacteroidetes bacterium]|nr:molybdopterin-dependent oxidoreductase [Bacteroidota bacterium]